MSLTRRPYADSDLPRVLDTMSHWIAAAGRIGYDHIGEIPHRVYENLRGRRPVGETVHLWEDTEGLAGLAIMTRFGNSFDVFTAPRHRGGDAELEMIDFAAAGTARLHAPDPADPHILTDVFAADTDRRRLLSGAGFTEFRIWDDVRERALDEPFAGPPVAEGFTVRSARFDDAAGLAAARNASFDDDWTGEAYREQFMDKPGYDPRREILAVAHDGRVAAFTVYWTDPRNSIGHFEPVGTHADFQRLGLARAVMLHAMRLMTDQGIATVTVNHNAENVPARRLYESLGFHRAHQTLGYRRPHPGNGEHRPS
ncbi:GNAT family N-acetyltransferase [Phytomonospora sp. NPDC050363]|uniref:GNAT family N-acetyltransferase n=1 Tax=Phytomonospora sp. NPDC050363 TaxID=3155642 RepID=UPI00340EEF98